MMATASCGVGMGLDMMATAAARARALHTAENNKNVAGADRRLPPKKRKALTTTVTPATHQQQQQQETTTTPKRPYYCYSVEQQQQNNDPQAQGEAPLWAAAASVVSPYIASAPSPPAAAPPPLYLPPALEAADAKLKSQSDGRRGGWIAGKIGENKYVADYANDERSKCRWGLCKRPICRGELRLGKKAPCERTGHAKRTQWYHADCIFATFPRMSKSTKTIATVDDVERYWCLNTADQIRLQSLILQGSSSSAAAAAAAASSSSSALTIATTIVAPSSGSTSPSMSDHYHHHQCAPVITTNLAPQSASTSPAHYHHHQQHIAPIIATTNLAPTSGPTSPAHYHHQQHIAPMIDDQYHHQIYHHHDPRLSSCSSTNNNNDSAPPMMLSTAMISRGASPEYTTAPSSPTNDGISALDVSSRIRAIGSDFEEVAYNFAQCGIDGRYISSRSHAEMDELFDDFGVSQRQKRRRICYELGLPSPYYNCVSFEV